MENSQYEAMMRFHQKTERAYRASGQTAQADAALAQIEKMENMSVCDSCGEWIVTAEICSECGQEADLMNTRTT